VVKPQSSARVSVGVFGAPHGVRGELRFKSFTGDPLAITAYAPLTDTTGERRFVFQKARPLKDDMLVVSVKGISDRDSAAALTGTEVFVPRAQLPPPDEDEFYHVDLEGLTAIDPQGQRLGHVSAVLNFGAGDILEVTGEGDAPPMLVPFTKAIVPTIDFDAGTLTIIMPDFIGDEEPDA